MLNERLQKSLGRKDIKTDVWLILGKSFDLSKLGFTVDEKNAMNNYIDAHANAGLSAEQIVRAFELDFLKAGSQDSVISSVFSPKAGTENFTNLRSPGMAEAKIGVSPGRSGRAVSRSDDAFVGQNTNDRRHKPGYPQKYGDPSFGHEEDELTISGQDYASQRQSSGSSEDRQGSAARYREPGAAVRGERNPDFQVLQGRGASGTYGRGTYLESIKNAKEQELAKSQSRVLSPERLQAFRYGRPIPVRDPTPEMRKSVLTKGIVDKLTTKEARRLTDEGEAGYAPGVMSEESSEEGYEPSLTKLEDDEAKLEEALRLDEEAKRLQEAGFVEESIDHRAKAMKIRATISKSHYATTMKAHLQAGREAI